MLIASVPQSAGYIEVQIQHVLQGKYIVLIEHVSPGT